MTSQNFPNNSTRCSVVAENSLTTDFRSRRSTYSWCTAQTARLLSLCCITVLLSHVFRCRRLLKDRSASHDVTGMTSSNLSKTSTCVNNCRTSDTWLRMNDSGRFIDGVVGKLSTKHMKLDAKKLESNSGYSRHLSFTWPHNRHDSRDSKATAPSWFTVSFSFDVAVSISL